MQPVDWVTFISSCLVELWQRYSNRLAARDQMQVDKTVHMMVGKGFRQVLSGEGLMVGVTPSLL